MYPTGKQRVAGMSIRRQTCEHACADTHKWVGRPTCGCPPVCGCSEGPSLTPLALVPPAGDCQQAGLPARRGLRSRSGPRAGLTWSVVGAGWWRGGCSVTAIRSRPSDRLSRWCQDALLHQRWRTRSWCPDSTATGTHKWAGTMTMPVARVNKVRFPYGESTPVLRALATGHIRS